jgi:hypothetical protein
MVCKGRVVNGVVVLDEKVRLAEGTEVTVETVESPRESIFDRLQTLVGRGENLPEDLAEQHDHYLTGGAKS